MDPSGVHDRFDARRTKVIVGCEELLNRAGTTFRKLPEDKKQGLTEAKAIALMLAQPSMIKRPVLVRGGEILVGFKPDQYAAALTPPRPPTA